MWRLWLFSWIWSDKDNSIKYKSLSCNKDYSNKLDKELKKKRLKNTFKFSNNDIKKCMDECIHECMDEWEKFNETSLPKKDEFYSNLNMEDITDADYLYACKKSL